MALRQVDIYLPDDGTALSPEDAECTVLGTWRQPLSDGGSKLTVLLDSDGTEALLDWLHHATDTDAPGFRIAIMAVEATIPRPEEDEDEDSGDDQTERINREELFQYADDAAETSYVYFALVALSTVVAAGGMIRDNIAVVIGAMVIAPLIGPNISLALGTTLGNTSILRRAMAVNIAGLVLSLLLAIGMGAILTFDPETSEIRSRTAVGLADVALALAAGAAGALSVTRGVSTALIGVMVSVALLPPLVAVGLYAGGGYFDLAYRAGLLTVVNVVSINLAGVCTFLVQGVRPLHWQEAEQAKTSTRIAVALWIAILAALVTAILLARRVGS